MHSTRFSPIVASALFVAIGLCATAVLCHGSLLFASSLLDVVQVGTGTSRQRSDDPNWAPGRDPRLVATRPVRLNHTAISPYTEALH
jgi:hypothetical protein